jgi:putative MATE family efflux protein
LVGGFLAKDFLSWLGAKDEVAHLGAQYLRIYFMGSSAMYILVMGSSIFQGAGNTTVPMFAMMLATLLNMVLDPLLIYGLVGFPRLGVRGAATAAVVSQAIAAVLVLGLLSKGSKVIRVHPGRWRLGAMAGKVLAIGLPSSGQLLSRSLMGLALMGIVARSGTAAVAAYGIGLRFHMMILIPAFSFGNALSTLVGQNLGARRPDRAQSATWLAVGIGEAIMAASIVFLMAFAPWLVERFDKNPEVIRIGAVYLWLVSPAHLFATLAIILGRALQGAGATLAPMVITLVALWGLQVPLAVGLSKIVQPSVVGIWWAINIATLVHGVMLVVWFQTGRWKRVEL